MECRVYICGKAHIAIILRFGHHKNAYTGKGGVFLWFGGVSTGSIKHLFLSFSYFQEMYLAKHEQEQE
jgi:hypothetical protein